MQVHDSLAANFALSLHPSRNRCNPAQLIEARTPLAHTRVSRMFSRHVRAQIRRDSEHGGGTIWGFIGE